MKVRRAYVSAAVALVAALAIWSSATRVAGQPTATVVDMDGSLVLVSDGRVFARRPAALDADVSWSWVATVPAETRVAAIRHLADAPNHYFLVLTEDGDAYRYDGLNRRFERTGNLFGVAPGQRVRPKTIGAEPIRNPTPGGR
jgi:hypothetical protein